MSENNNVAVMAKTIGMFNVLTGKQLTEAEGFAFIGLWDIADEHVNGPQLQSPANELFDAATKVMDPSDLDIPMFVGHDLASGPDTTAITEVTRDAVYRGTGAMMVTDEGVEHIPAKSIYKSPDEIAAETVGEYGYKVIAAKLGVNAQVLEAFAKAESADNKQPIGGIVETAAGVFDARKSPEDHPDTLTTTSDKPEEMWKPGYEPDRPDVLVTRDQFWKPGYLWKLSVIPFDQERGYDAYFVHFRDRPTQEQFDEHYALFTQGKAKVHLLESDGRGSKRITDEYCSFRERDAAPASAQESLQPDGEWPEGKRFRIKFWDQHIHQTNYVYFDDKPGGIVLNKYHHAKCYAVVQPRPKA